MFPPCLAYLWALARPRLCGPLNCCCLLRRCLKRFCYVPKLRFLDVETTGKSVFTETCVRVHLRTTCTQSFSSLYGDKHDLCKFCPSKARLLLAAPQIDQVVLGSSHCCEVPWFQFYGTIFLSVWLLCLPVSATRPPTWGAAHSLWHCAQGPTLVVFAFAAFRVNTRSRTCSCMYETARGAV